MKTDVADTTYNICLTEQENVGSFKSSKVFTCYYLTSNTAASVAGTDSHYEACDLNMSSRVVVIGEKYE